MLRKEYAMLENILEINNGYLQTSDLLSIPISKFVIYRFIKEKGLKKIKNGFYKDEKIVYDDFLFETQITFSNIVFSHECGLYLHGLMEREPSKIIFTTLKNFYKSSFKKSFFKIYYQNDKLFNKGVQSISTPFGNKVKVYEKERVLCEILKNKDKMDIQIFTFAWKKALLDGDLNFYKLSYFSNLLGVSEKLRNILEINWYEN